MAEKKTILVVDDEPDVLVYLTTFFEDNGYTTLQAKTGIEAINQVRSHHPDLVTLDITMPEESGLRMYRTMRETEKYKKIPIILITGVSPELKRFIGRRKQVPLPEGYFEKPIDLEALLKKIRELIG